MQETPRELAGPLFQYLEHEEARLESLQAELTHLEAALRSGQADRIGEALDNFLRQVGAERQLRVQQEGLRKRLPKAADGRVHWAVVEASLDKDTAQAIHRQRERLWKLAQQIQKQLRRVAVLAWFGQELYGRILAAILSEGTQSGQYGRAGQPEESATRHLLQLLG